jgi:hypothetical protein
MRAVAEAHRGQDPLDAPSAHFVIPPRASQLLITRSIFPSLLSTLTLTDPR